MLKKLLVMLLVDLLLAAVLVAGTWFFIFKMPREMTPVGMGKEQGENRNGPEESRVHEAGPNEWYEKFKDHFTEEVQMTQNHYSSPSVAVDVEEYSFGEGNDKVTYYLADIYIASLECLQTKFAHDTYGIGYTDGLDVMAGQANAVVALNGDSYSYDNRMENGTLVRNGMVYRMGSTGSDLCVLYKDGVMKIYGSREFDPADEIFLDDIYQTWIFGPALLDENGEIPDTYNIDPYILEAHPRAAIGYYEPGHYCMLCADGRQEGYSRGMTMKEMSEVFYELGCETAYNLDGGHCAFMTFGDDFANHPFEYNTDVSDCILIAEP